MPTTLDDLDEARVQGPARRRRTRPTSSPGLAFLLATVGASGERRLPRLLGRAEGQRASRSPRAGRRRTPSTSPAASGEGRARSCSPTRPRPPFTVPEGGDAPTTGALLDTCFRQVEYAGVHRGREEPGGCRAVASTSCSPTTSRPTSPGQMYMYPVAPRVDAPRGVGAVRAAGRQPRSRSRRPTSPSTARPWIDDWTGDGHRLTGPAGDHAHSGRRRRRPRRRPRGRSAARCAGPSRSPCRSRSSASSSPGRCSAMVGARVRRRRHARPGRVRRRVLRRPRTWRIIGLTLAQAGLATTASRACSGVPGAYVLYRRRFPRSGGRARARHRAVRAADRGRRRRVPFAARRAADRWASWASTSTFAAIVARARVLQLLGRRARRSAGCGRGSTRAPSEAARTLGASPCAGARCTVTLPALAPAIASAASLVFLFCASAFGMVLVLGGLQFGTIETEIWVPDDPAPRPARGRRAVGRAARGRGRRARGGRARTRPTRAGADPRRTGHGGRTAAAAPPGRGAARRRARLDVGAAAVTAVVVVLLALPLVNLVVRSLQHRRRLGARPLRGARHDRATTLHGLGLAGGRAPRCAPRSTRRRSRSSSGLLVAPRAVAAPPVASGPACRSPGWTPSSCCRSACRR